MTAPESTDTTLRDSTPPRGAPIPAAPGEAPATGRRAIVIGFLLWQGAWLLLVVGAGQGHPILGSLLGLGAIATALTLRHARPREWGFVAVAAFIGLWIDSLLHLLGLTEFPANARTALTAPGVVAPLWMALLWANLAAHCGPGSAFGWLADRPRLAATIGLTSGPLAYIGGEKLGAITLVPPLVTPVIVLAVLWGFAFPGLFVLRSAITRKDAR